MCACTFNKTSWIVTQGAENSSLYLSSRKSYYVSKLVPLFSITLYVDRHYSSALLVTVYKHNSYIFVPSRLRDNSGRVTRYVHLTENRYERCISFMLLMICFINVFFNTVIKRSSPQFGYCQAADQLWRYSYLWVWLGTPSWRHKGYGWTATCILFSVINEMWFVLHLSLLLLERNF